MIDSIHKATNKIFKDIFTIQKLQLTKQKNVSEYHHVNSYGVNVGNVSETIHMDLYFQHGCKYVKYLMPLCVQGVLN